MENNLEFELEEIYSVKHVTEHLKHENQSKIMIFVGTKKY